MIRSLLYAVAFYVASALYMVLGSWLLLAPRNWAMVGLKAHALTCVWLLRVIVGTRLEVRNREKLPPGPVLVASKHQSA
ncbi:MAG: 1-acyl-sn-glycerol-3-phosphate acyltransferase, partial [Hyphomicrobiales bacterium]|nr:1-acyl-sn-glycerol-3-phosphate acyltransferase [Hyphomicrobiales bacterium]